MLRTAAFLCAALVLAVPAPAVAAPGGPWSSTPAPVTFEGALELIDAIAFDTGWQPAASPVQVRFSINVGTGFTCSMDGEGELTWPAALDLVYVPTPDTGLLVMDMGLEVHSLYRFVLDLGAGVVWMWEGEIPFLPNFDFRFADTAAFDPFLLPMGNPEDVTVSDAIPDTLLYEYDITDLIVPIPGIGGGVALYAGGLMDATLRGIDIAADPEIVTYEGEHVFPAVPGDDPSLMRDSIWEGELMLAGTLVLTPTIYVELLGATWNVAAFPITIPFPAAPIPWALDPWPTTWPLPEVRVPVASLAVGDVFVGDSIVAGAPVYNDGDLDLVVTATVTGDGLTLAAPPPLVVPPRDVGTAAVVFAPLVAGNVSGTLTLETNDPDEPLIVLPVYAGAMDLKAPDAGPDPDASSLPDAGTPGAEGDDALPGGCVCGCRVVSSPPHPAAGAGAAVALALGVLFFAVRRRKRIWRS